MAPRWILPALLLAFASAAAARGDRERLIQAFDSTDGLPASDVRAIAQDDEGFLWVSTAGGLARLDGQRIVAVPGDLSFLHNARTGRRILLRGPGDTVQEAHGLALHAVAGPGGGPLPATEAAAVDSRSRLWIVVNGALWREHPRPGAPGDWSRLSMEGLAPEAVERLFPGGDAVYASAPSGLYRLDGRTARRVSEVPDPIAVVQPPGGPVIFLANRHREANNDGAVFVVRGGGTELLFEPGRGPRGIDLALSGDGVIAAFDTGIWAISPRGAAEQFEFGDRPHCCGGLFADREGSLWIGTSAGLLQLPSPDSVSTGDPGGFLDLASDGTGLWTTTWVGASQVVRAPGGLEFTATGIGGLSPCRTSTGETWLISREGRVRMRAGRSPEILPGPGFGGYFSGCAPGPEGRTWFASARGILVADAQDPVPRVVPAALPVLPDIGDARGAVAEVPPETPAAPGAGQSLLFFGNGASVCHARTEEVLSLREAAWSCAEFPGSHSIMDIVLLPGGALYAAAQGAGVYRWRGGADDRWELVPASRELRPGTLSRMRASPRGGVWVLAEGDIQSVEDAPSLPGGWRVLERLGRAQGLADGRAPRDIAESEAGAIWVTTMEGRLTYIPPTARTSAIPVPRIYLGEISTDGAARSGSEPLELSHTSNRIELRFASPSFRDPSRLRFRHRVRDDDPWSEPETDSFLRFAGLGSGRYAISAEASLDGVNWSPEPARFEFTVLPPWYLQGWFLLVAAAALLAAFLAAHRLRLRSYLRLERQRARIARDLHDEIGSGLGSIGLLAAIAQRSGGRGQEEALLGQIRSVSAELGASLTDIVTSLRPGALTLRSLFGHIVERGTRLCAGGTPAFEAAGLETLPENPVSVPVRLNVLLVAAEAIHNAVRHAGAQHVSVSLAPAAGGGWQLRVDDDGSGFDPGSGNQKGDESKPGVPIGGLGLASMRRRAEQLGGSIAWLPRPGGGTRVELLFQPMAEDRG